MIELTGEIWSEKFYEYPMGLEDINPLAVTTEPIMFCGTRNGDAVFGSLELIVKQEIQIISVRPVKVKITIERQD